MSISNGISSASELRGAFDAALGASHPGEAMLRSMQFHPDLRRLLEAPAGILEGYSVGLHHAMVLNQRWKYRLGSDLPLPGGPDSPYIGERGLDYALAHHDLDKHVPDREKNKADEHARTLAVIDAFRDAAPFSPRQLDTIYDLISNNDLGHLMRRVVRDIPPREEKLVMRSLVLTEDLTFDKYLEVIDLWERTVVETKKDEAEIAERIDACARSFRARALTLGMPPADLLGYQTAMFQSDTTGYTWDAFAEEVRGTPSLDYLYVPREWPTQDGRIFSNAPGEVRLLFSPFFENVFQRLRDELRNG